MQFHCWKYAHFFLFHFFDNNIHENINESFRIKLLWEYSMLINVFLNKLTKLRLHVLK
jgi:hypothetical protein